MQIETFVMTDGVKLHFDTYGGVSMYEYNTDSRISILCSLMVA